MPSAGNFPKSFSSFQARPELDYMTAGERDGFRTLRKSGGLTFFRVQTCRMCGADVPIPKLYCSKECKDGHGEQIARAEGDAE